MNYSFNVISLLGLQGISEEGSALSVIVIFRSFTEIKARNN